jgi:predicted signal transduction protein with EAL and GGDEF domain
MDQDVGLDTTISLEPITDSVLSRLGGDEFVILLPEVKDRFAAGSVAHRILKRLEQPFIAGGSEVFLTTSIGIATYPNDGQTADVLIGNADTAMYHAKQQGKAAYQYYSAEMNVASVERLTLESGLRRALEEERLEVHYQPQIDVASRRIVGAEALLRWNDPVRGPISPATFIPIAEDGGLILQIGEWVLRRACRQAAEWQRAGLPPIPVAVNVSGVQFRRQDVCELVKRVLEESGLDASLLRIEITETSLMSVRERAAQVLEQLRDIGVGVALDDFGTGYSSLSYLKSFPLDMLKIDRSFIAEMLTDVTTASITEAIVTMTRIIGLRVLAEGVENQAQFDFLKKLGCDMVQGFHFSAALPAAEFSKLLASPLMLPIARAEASL